MKIKPILTCILLSIWVPAAADFEDVVPVYEIAASDFAAPVTPSGSVTFKACDECDNQIIRVTPDTIYKVNRKIVLLRDFREMFLRLKTRRKNGDIVAVRHDLESDIVTGISITL